MLVGNHKWHLDADVIIVGYGCAGAVAAITAHDAGANVIILEKQPAASHISNTYMSGGGFICPTDIRGATRFMNAINRWKTD